MSLLLLLGGKEGETGTSSERIAVTHEYPPDKLAWRIDPPRGAPSRWAADEPLAENVIDDIRLVDEMPGGDKEATGVLARNPRTPWSDLAPYSDVSVYGPGVEEVGAFRLDKAPESDGDRMAIEPAAVGWQAALEDDKALIGPGFISSDLSKWQEPSTQRRVLLLGLDYLLSLESATGWQGTGELDPGLIFTFGQKIAEKKPIAEMWFDGGGVDIGALRGDFKSLTGATKDARFDDYLFLSTNDEGSTQDLSPDFDQSNATNQAVKAGDSGRKYAGVSAQFNEKSGAFDFTNNSHAFLNLRVEADTGLIPQGEWPDIGFTAKQMLGYAIPRHTPLRVTDESLEDDGYIIPQAWFSDPGSMAQVVTELTKYGLLDWFVRGERLFQMRFPGTYGRRWQAYAGLSELQEAGLDAARLWREIVVQYQDVDGSTKTVGPPGSGATEETRALEITDPDHPAVRAKLTRKDLLGLKGISTPQRAREAGERWLDEANLLSRSGSCGLTGYVMDDRSIWRPVSQVRSGDFIRFPDSCDRSYRKITHRDYDHTNRKASLSLDGPPEGIQALLERYQAVLVQAGLS